MLLSGQIQVGIRLNVKNGQKRRNKPGKDAEIFRFTGEPYQLYMFQIKRFGK